MKFVDWLRRNKLLAMLSAVAALLLIAVVALVHKNIQLNNNDNSKNISSEYKNSEATARDTLQTVHYRLPKHIVPKNYKLVLRPDMTNKTFDGTAVINIDILQPTKQITLHSNQLIIRKVSLTNSNNEIFRVSHAMSGDKREFLFVDSERNITNASHYLLKIEFSGRLDKRIIAIYASNLKKGGIITMTKKVDEHEMPKKKSATMSHKMAAFTRAVGCIKEHVNKHLTVQVPRIMSIMASKMVERGTHLELSNVL